MAQLTKPQFEALRTYAKENGRTWKSKLMADWMNGRCQGELQHLRNAFGPRWLLKFQFASYDGIVWPQEGKQ